MSRGFKPYFYFVRIFFSGLDLKKQIFKAIHVVLYGKYIKQNFTIGIYDEAVVIVLGYVDSHINHSDTPNIYFDTVRIHRALYVL